jgi:hypothetical protein
VTPAVLEEVIRRAEVPDTVFLRVLADDLFDDWDGISPSPYDELEY